MLAHRLKEISENIVIVHRVYEVAGGNPVQLNFIKECYSPDDAAEFIVENCNQYGALTVLECYV